MISLLGFYIFEYDICIIAIVEVIGLYIVSISYRDFDDRSLFVAFLLSYSLGLILICSVLISYIFGILHKIFMPNVIGGDNPLLIIPMIIILYIFASSGVIVVISLFLSLCLEYKCFLNKSKNQVE